MLDIDKTTAESTPSMAKLLSDKNSSTCLKLWSLTGKSMDALHYLKYTYIYYRNRITIKFSDSVCSQFYSSFQSILLQRSIVRFEHAFVQYLDGGVLSERELLTDTWPVVTIEAPN